MYQLKEKNKLFKLKIVHWNCFRYDSSKQVELERFIDIFKPDTRSVIVKTTGLG